MKFFLLLILGLVEAASGQIVQCPFPYRAIGNGCYNFPTVTATWYDANLICQFSGGYLTNIDSAAKQSALYAYHYAHFNSTFYSRWIGATDSLSDGTWRWVPSGATVDYNNWNSGEPWTGDYYNCPVWSPVNGYWTTTGCCDFQTYPLCETWPL